MGQVEFRTADHLACLREGRAAVCNQSAQRTEEVLEATIVGGPGQGALWMQLATKTGAWLLVQPSMVNVTELGA